MKISKKIAINFFMAFALANFCLKNAWALLPIEHWTETSGAQVWLVQSHAIPMVDVEIGFDAGTRRDLRAQAGLTDAVALMTAKGVRASGDDAAMDENALAEAWADLGADFGAGATKDGFAFSLRSLTEPDLLDKATRLAARQMGEPAWPETVWQRERERWSAAIKEQDTRPGAIATKAFAAAVYGDHPYGYITTGDTLARIGVQDMQAFHARHIRACRARIAIVGALTREKAHALVHTLLSRLPVTTSDADACQPLPAVPEVQPLEQGSEQRVPFASAQAHVLMGQPGLARSDPDYVAILVGNHILGGGSFTSRLMNEVREKRGLSYSVGSFFAPGLHAGAFTVSLQTRPDQAAQAVQVVREVIRRFVADGPTAEELRAAKDNLVGGFALRIDSNRKLLGNVANMARHSLPLDYLEHWSARIEALTAADVHAAVQRKLQPERMAVVVVGAGETGTPLGD